MTESPPHKQNTLKNRINQSFSFFCQTRKPWQIPDPTEHSATGTNPHHTENNLLSINRWHINKKTPPNAYNIRVDRGKPIKIIG